MTFGNIKLRWTMEKWAGYHAQKIINEFRKISIKTNGKRNKMKL